MKLLYLLIGIFYMFLTVAAAQTSYPKGSYMSIEEIVAKTPSENYNLQVKLSKNGSDCKVKTLDKSIRKKTIKKEIYAISDGNNLLINTSQFDQSTDYMCVESEGRYLVFKSGIDKDDAVTAAVMGGAIGGAAAASKRHTYVMDSENGIVYKIDKAIMMELLEGFPELQAEFGNEKKQKDNKILLDYLSRLNNHLKTD